MALVMGKQGYVDEQNAGQNFQHLTLKGPIQPMDNCFFTNLSAKIIYWPYKRH
jgi:hypothetical protein